MKFIGHIFISFDRCQLVPYGAMSEQWTFNPGVASTIIARGNGYCWKVQVDSITIFFVLRKKQLF